MDLVDVISTETVINQRRLPPLLLMTPRLLCQHTVVDANHSGGWTQKFQTAKVTFQVTKCHP